MLKIYICPKCYNIRMISKKTNAVCLHCNSVLKPCDISYDTYTAMDQEKRDAYIKRWREKYT